MSKHKNTKGTRNLFKREFRSGKYGKRCFYCRQRVSMPTIEHVLPRSHCSTTLLVPAHHECNSVVGAVSGIDLDYNYSNHRISTRPSRIPKKLKHLHFQATREYVVELLYVMQHPNFIHDIISNIGYGI